MACWSPSRAKPEEQLTFHDKILRDIPLTSREWTSTTHEMTDIEIRGPPPVMHDRQRRSLARYIVTKPASELGGPVHFSSGTYNPISYEFPELKPREVEETTQPTVVRRRVDEHSIQACLPPKSSTTQTARFEPVNACVQYEAQVASGMRLSKHAKASLREFILKPEINFAIEQALQQNETMDVFARDFDKLGVDESRMAMLDASLGSGAETGLTEWRNFHDVTYTREKRIECIHWVPEEPDVVAASYLDNLTYGQRLETMGKPRPSCILLWSFHNPLSPHAALLSPSEVVTFSFCPTDRRFVVGGLITGQMVLWRVTDQELGVTAAKRGKVARKKREKEGHDKGDVEKSKEKVKTVMTTTKNKPALEIKHKLVSTIDDSHKRACRSIAWLPHWLDVERKGKCVDNRSTLEGEEETVEKAKFFVTVAGDGQVFLWDFQSARDAVVRGEHDFTWRPIHSVQLQRQDSGTEMGCTHILPLASMNLTQKAQENRESNFLSNFFATTEEGEVIFGDWAAVGSAEKKPELVKSLCEVSKTFRPLLELRESHRMSDLMLAVSDWEFSLWYIGGSAPSLTRPRRANMDEEEEEGDEVETARPVKSLADRIREPIFRSAAPSNYFACGACSPSRPAVLYLGRVDGSVDVWDFTDQSHQPLMSFPVTAAGLTSMTFCPEGKSLMAVGDDHGHLHVLKLPVNLVWGPDREEEIVRQILDHAYHNLDGVPERKTMLEALKQQNEKDTTTSVEETVVLTDSMVDEEYKKTLAEFCEAAGIPQASSSEAPPM